MSNVDALRDRLIGEREAAQTAAEIIAALARIEWYNSQFDPERRTPIEALTCPDDRIPRPTALATWLPECPI